MTALICMLRGVNVGGHNQIKMDALKKLCLSLGLESPQTYVQSGNVVFRSNQKDLRKLAKKIEDAIERSHGFRSDVILRTPSEMKAAIAANPFAKRHGLEPGKLLLTFLAALPEAAAAKELGKTKYDPEEVHLVGRELYIYFPNGAGKSKLPWSRLATLLKTTGTARNWNTVTKLLEMAENLEAP